MLGNDLLNTSKFMNIRNRLTNKKKRGKYKKKEKCKRVDTLVDESSDGRDKNMEFDKVMSWD